VTPNDEHALEEKITALLTDTALRAKISTNAKRKAEKYTVVRMVDETATLLERI
jgi:hypothetical protein